MKELFEQIPALWMAIGMAVTGAIFYLANRKVFAMQRDAVATLISTYKEQVAALEKERSDYREHLHEEKKQHNATKLAMAELEARPDLRSVNDVMLQVARSLQEVASKLHARDPIFARIEDGFKQTAEALKKVLERLQISEQQ